MRNNNLVNLPLKLTTTNQIFIKNINHPIKMIITFKLNHPRICYKKNIFVKESFLMINLEIYNLISHLKGKRFSITKAMIKSKFIIMT